MNPIITFLQNPCVLISIILVLFYAIYTLTTYDDFTGNISDKIPPHIEQLSHQQMTPLCPTAQTSIDSNENTLVPNYGKTGENNTNENTHMIPGNIYRMKTGRDAYEQEQFVNIYDSNFGGLVGTNMGL